MNELIYNQTQIPKKKWRYGFRSSAATGCGWIATYNALLLLGQEDVDVEKLIRSYERQLPLVNGNAGTIFCGPALLLRKWGYRVKMSVHPRQYDDLCRSSDVCILFYYWRKGLKIGSHFAALQQLEDGVWGYNTYTDSTGPDYYGKSLEAFIKERKYWGTALICISKK